MVKIKGLPEQFNKLWEKCVILLEQAVPGDLEHTKVMVEDILNARRIVKFDLEVILPSAMLHDVGHIAVLEKHFKTIVIQERLKNGKLIEISAAGKIVKNLLERMNLAPEKIEEVLGIVKMQEFGASRDIEPEKFYNTHHKKLFHDFDLLSTFNRRRMKILKKASSDREQFRQIIASQLKRFFFDELRELAEQRFRDIEGIRKSSSWAEH